MYALQTNSTINHIVLARLLTYVPPPPNHPNYCAPSVVLVGDHVDERVGGEGEDHEDVGGGVVPLGEVGGGEQEVGLVVQSEDHGGKGADDVTKKIVFENIRVLGTIFS